MAEKGEDNSVEKEPSWQDKLCMCPEVVTMLETWLLKHKEELNPVIDDAKVANVRENSRLKISVSVRLKSGSVLKTTAQGYKNKVCEKLEDALTRLLKKARKELRKKAFNGPLKVEKI